MNTFSYTEIKKKTMSLLILFVMPCIGFSQESSGQPEAPTPADMPSQLSAKITTQGPPPPPGPINDMALPVLLLSVIYVGYFFHKKNNLKTM